MITPSPDDHADVQEALDHKTLARDATREQHIAQGTISCGNLSLGEMRGLIGSSALTLEQELWLRGYCAARSCRDGDAGGEMAAGDALIEHFRLRFPGVLPCPR